MNDATCMTCPHFSPKQQTEFREGCGAAKQKGSCRINPPAQGGWPATWEDYFCGSHPDRQPHLECASTTILTHETFPTESDMRRLVDALEKIAICAQRAT